MQVAVELLEPGSDSWNSTFGGLDFNLESNWCTFCAMVSAAEL